MAGTSPAMTMWGVGDRQEIQTGQQWDTPGLDPGAGHDVKGVLMAFMLVSGTGP